MLSLGIIIPAKNEYETLIDIVKYLKKKKLTFFIIDDKSSDQTHKYLIKNKINFIRNKKTIGYTASIIKGITYFKKNKNIKYLLTMDADGEHKPIYINKFIKHIEKNYNTHLIIAERKYKNRISEVLISKLFNFFFKISDPFSGFKLYEANLLFKNKNNVNRNDFLFDYLVCLLKNKYLISNIKMRNKKIPNRKSRIGNKFLTNLKILFMLKYLFFKTKFKKS